MPVSRPYKPQRYTTARVDRMRLEFPDAIIGGTGTGISATVDPIVGESAALDYSLYPDFDASIGFTQRGCRLSCKFCVVPVKEGKPRAENTIAAIWRGEPWPKHLHLLDNDFFGGPEWQERIAEIRAGGFKVSFTQGINVRAVTAEVAAAIASIEYRDDGFGRRRLYTAWDNLKDKEVFFRGVDTLEAAGVPGRQLMAYMLVGYDKRETWERIWHRFEKMVARGIRPYPMVYGDRERTLPLGGCNKRIGHRTLSEFQRWAIRKAYTFIPFEHYDVNAKGRAVVGQLDLLEPAA